MSDKLRNNQYDEAPKKLEKKSYEEITAVGVIELPKNRVKPVNQRIFCIAQDPGLMKTDGGIILPSVHNASEGKGGQKRKLMRYFVVDVADDCDIRFNKTEDNPEGSKIERGDEVFPFIPAEAVEWSFPETFDFDLNIGYVTIHQTELAGVSISPLIEKEEEEEAF
jgi:hypothetical protein